MTTKGVEKQIIAHKIGAFAKEQGFDLVGFAKPEPSREAYVHYEKWLDQNFNADMDYMSREDAVEKRKSATALLENAKTVICLATNYYHDQPPLPEGHGRVARYAYGRDYHKTLKSRLRKTEQFLQDKFTAQTLSYVDTGPLLERSLAEQAGLGFTGKNTCLITKEFGSWVLLSEIITDLPLTPTSSAKPRGLSCGTCTRCIDACPTNAITVDPKTGRTQINARKCISYLTIEHKGPIPPELAAKIKPTSRLYGCDICQEVCPHNCRAKTNPNNPITETKIAGDSLSLEKITAIKSDEQFLETFAGSPVMRTKKAGLQRNATILQ
jgi:epoxyqueuosine reductase